MPVRSPEMLLLLLLLPVERKEATYPEIDFDIAGATKFPVAHLERDGHLVILMQLLVEALSAVGRKLDVVGHRCREQPGCREEQRRC